jgi:hypothetical protein
MEIWKSENNPNQQVAISLIFAIVGLLLAISCRNFISSGSVGEMAGFALGILVFFISGYYLMVSGKQTVIVDPNKRCITIEDNNRFGSKTRVIEFQDIVEVRIGWVGKKTTFYYYFLLLKLKNGENYPLFNQHYPGSFNRATVESWKTKLENYLNI